MKTPAILCQICLALGLIILLFGSCTKNIDDPPSPALLNTKYDLPPQLLDSIFTEEQPNPVELLDKIIKNKMVIHEGTNPPEVFFNGSGRVELKFTVENKCIYDDRNSANVDSIYGKYEQSILITKNPDSSTVAHVSYSSIGDAGYPKFPSGLDTGSGQGFVSGNGNTFTIFFKVTNGKFDNIPYQAFWIISGTVPNAPTAQEVTNITTCLVMGKKGDDPKDRLAKEGTVRIFQDTNAPWNQSDVTISNFTPTEGPYSTIVTINGSGFSSKKEENIVKINGVVVTVLAASTNQIQVEVPKRAGTGTVTVQVFNKTVTGNVFTYIPSYTVSTLAGSGTPGLLDGTGISAQFNRPFGVAVDAQGNIYVADTENHSIRKITSTGVVSILAGNGKAGSRNGIDTSSQFNEPRSVAVDAQGNIYVADMENHRVRKITPTAEVSTLAGSGKPGFLNGSALEAQFEKPRGIAVDIQGSIYVADMENHSIRKITSTGVVSTLAGSDKAGSRNGIDTSARFNRPRGIVVDAQGNVYVGDTENHLIRKITSSRIVSTLAGSVDKPGSDDGSTLEARFRFPRGLALDAQGNIYVADKENHSIRKISSTGEVSTLAGTGQTGFLDGIGSQAQFSHPRSVAIDAQGIIYVADESNHRIRKMVLE